MLKAKEWEEFRATGLMWFVNTTLHLFGWALAVDVDENNKVISAYPAKCRFRGFDEKSNDDGYKKVTKYLSANVDVLIKDLD